jgi:hypothetical protein
MADNVEAPGIDNLPQQNPNLAGPDFNRADYFGDTHSVNQCWRKKHVRRY